MKRPPIPHISVVADAVTGSVVGHEVGRPAAGADLRFHQKASIPRNSRSIHNVSRVTSRWTVQLISVGCDRLWFLPQLQW